MNSDSTTDAGDAPVRFGAEIADPDAAADGPAAGHGAPRRVEPELPETSGWRYMLASLANRDFRYLWLGMLAMMGATQIGMFTVGFLVYELTSSPFLLGLMEAGAAVPMLTLGLFSGAIADRVDRKLVIQVGQVGVLIVALFVAISIVTGVVTWVHLLAAMVLEGAAFSIMMPARLAIVPQLVGPRRVTNALALNAAAMSATTLVAPAVAGTLYAIIGPGRVYFVMAGMYVVALLLTAIIPKIVEESTTPKTSMLSDIKVGLAYVRRRQMVMVLLIMGLVTTLLAFPFRILVPVFVVDVYGRGPESMGLMLAMMGLGSLLGALFVASIGKGRRGLILIGGSFLTGVALMLTATIPIYFAAVCIMVLLGLGDAGRRTLNQALIMEDAEDAYRGRVMSLFMMNFGLMPLSILPAGITTEYLGGQWTIGIMAGMLLAFSAVILITQKQLRNTP